MNAKQRRKAKRAPKRTAYRERLAGERKGL